MKIGQIPHIVFELFLKNAWINRDSLGYFLKSQKAGLQAVVNFYRKNIFSESFNITLKKYAQLK